LHALNMDVKGVALADCKRLPQLLGASHAHRIHALGVPPSRIRVRVRVRV